HHALSSTPLGRARGHQKKQYSYGDEEVEEPLAGDEATPFSFERFTQVTGVEVAVLGGAVVEDGAEGGQLEAAASGSGSGSSAGSNFDGIARWERWFGQCL
ncbi:hypothetical protein KEM52_003928, partial [Ascosphaera acerosa]